MDMRASWSCSWYVAIDKIFLRVVGARGPIQVPQMAMMGWRVGAEEAAHLWPPGDRPRHEEYQSGVHLLQALQPAPADNWNKCRWLHSDLLQNGWE